MTWNGAAALDTLSPMSGSSGIRVIRLADVGGVDYWLEYRTATGQDAWLGTPMNGFGLEQGVLLRRAGGSGGDTLLLDPTPSPAAAWPGDRPRPFRAAPACSWPTGRSR